MSVYADSPVWPRHGMLWGHLISDSSLEELHEAASLAGLHPRAFDFDHYDWPETARYALQQASVEFVGARELTRILHRSGMRVGALERAELKAKRTSDSLKSLNLTKEIRLGQLRFEVVDAVAGLLGHSDSVQTLADEPGFKVARDFTNGNFRLQLPAESSPNTTAQLTNAAHILQAMLDEAALKDGGQVFLGQLLLRML